MTLPMIQDKIEKYVRTRDMSPINKQLTVSEIQANIAKFLEWRNDTSRSHRKIHRQPRQWYDRNTRRIHRVEGNRIATEKVI